MKNIFVVVLLILFQSAFSQAGSRRICNDKNAYRGGYQRMAAGAKHTIEIRNGALWSYGDNASGQLGDGTNVSRNTPAQIGNGTNWVSVSAGEAHTLAIKADGTLWSWGSNVYGQLGLGTNTDRNVPVQVGTGNGWISIAAGNGHSLAIKADGTLWGWGHNSASQLGDGTIMDKSTPTQIGSVNNWVEITAGTDRCFSLKSDGTLWGWGENSSGQLGDGTLTNQNIPKQIGLSNNWTRIVSGGHHTLALRSNGTLWTWGINSNGQLGDGTTSNKMSPVQIGPANNWVDIDAGQLHSLAIRSDGSLWTWGYNGDGQLGDATFIDKNLPTQIAMSTKWVAVNAGYHHSLGLSANGILNGWGSDVNGALGDGANVNQNMPIPVSSVMNWVKIISGGNHTLALRSDGTLWAWGSNNSGCLGDGSGSLKFLPVHIGTAIWIDIAAGIDHSLGIQSDGTLWAWGKNYNGQVGDGTTTDRNIPIQISSTKDWVSISGGGDHSMALKANGALWTWGNYTYGALGRPNVNTGIPQQVGLDTSWVRIQAGGGGLGVDHSLAIKSDGSLWAWGANTAGQLGDGSGANQTSPVKIGNLSDWVCIDGGQGFTQLIKADGTLWACGLNVYGSVGDGTNVNKTTPVQILPGSNNWLKVTAGTLHSSGLRADGSLWSWGYNFSGQLGDGSNGDKTVPVQTVPSNGWGDLGAGCEANSSLAIRPDRLSYCTTGANNLGQLGDGTNIQRNTFSCSSLVPVVAPDAQFTVNDTSICEGDSVHFTDQSVGSPTNWRWTFDGGFPHTSTNQNPVVVYNDSGTYQVKLVVSNSNGSDSIVKSGYIHVAANPVSGFITGNPDSVCSGSSSLLEVTGSSGNLQWQYSADGNIFSNLTGALSTTYTTPTLTQTTYYRIQATNGCGMDYSSSLKIEVKPLPLPVLTPTDTLICSSDSTHICASGGYSYLWNTGDISTCIFTKLAGGYWVTATGTNGCLNTSSHLNITIYPLPFVSVVVQGDTLSSFDAVTYQWYLNDEAIPGATDSVYVAQESGDYSLEVSDANGCKAISSSTTVIINGTNDFSSNDYLEISPNPFTDLIFIRSGNAGMHIEKMGIYDALGQILLSKETREESEDPIRIDMSMFIQGIYFIRVETSRAVVIRKLIK